eukprot:5829877-Amphidinium_carterae.1
MSGAVVAKVYTTRPFRFKVNVSEIPDQVVQLYSLRRHTHEKLGQVGCPGSLALLCWWGKLIFRVFNAFGQAQMQGQRRGGTGQSRTRAGSASRQR